MGEPRVALTVSGVIPDALDAEVAAGRRPRADHRVLAAHLDADVVDVRRATDETGLLGRALSRAGAGPLLAWWLFRHRRRYDVVLTDGEQVGIPFAILTRWLGRRGCRHVMIVHVLSVAKKAWLLRLTRSAAAIDHFLVYSSFQGDYVRERLGVGPERITLTPFMVDTEFFRPTTSPQVRPTICSAGLERRDYATLVRAVDGLDVDVVIAAASPWSKQADRSDEVEIPANVTIERLALDELRALYSRCRFVVMPLAEVDFQAGITTILEAMAMGKPVVCTRTPGQTDTIEDGVTGVYVPPADVAALRRAIEQLLDDPEQCDRMGAAARSWAVAHADVERYAERITTVVRSVG